MTSLTPEQKQAVASWIAAGDNLSAVQKKLGEQFQITMTYRDVRFLVDDLDLALKDPAPKIDTTDVSKSPVRSAGAEKKGATDKAKPNAGAAGDNSDAAEAFGEVADELADDSLEEAPGGVAVEVDKVTLLPGAIASGTVKFSDGVTGKWVVDQQGRPGFTEISQPGYRPSPADGQAFIQELSAQLQRRGF